VIDLHDAAWLWPLLVSPFVGSFLGVLIVRLPAQTPVGLSRSVCSHCGTRLGAADLIPLVSFLALRGRCRHCRMPIGVFHPAVEVAAVAVALWAVLSGHDLWHDPWLAPGPDPWPDPWPDPGRIWASCALGWTLLTLAWIDWTDLTLPDVLTLPLLLAGLALTLAFDPDDLTDHCLAAILAYLAFTGLAFAYRRLRGRDGLGGGDSKLIAAAGAWCGLAALPLVVLGSALLGLLAALGLAVAGRTMTSTTRIPFGPCIALAFWLVWLHGTVAEDLIQFLGRQ
jgi:leader peptidase (prepilin peptidase)/N-methyltransferase